MIQNQHLFDSLLSDCISHGNKKSAAKILEFYESGDSKLDISNRAFDEACKQGYQDLVRMMLKLGAVPTQHSVAAACLSRKDLAFVALLFEHERFDVGVPKECIAIDGPIKYHGLNMAAACILGKRIDILSAILDKFPFLSRIETDYYQDDSDSFNGISRKCGSLLNFACLHGRLDISLYFVISAVSLLVIKSKLSVTPNASIPAGLKFFSMRREPSSSTNGIGDLIGSSFFPMV